MDISKVSLFNPVQSAPSVNPFGRSSAVGGDPASSGGGSTSSGYPTSGKTVGINEATLGTVSFASGQCGKADAVLGSSLNTYC